jgi:hypothetical protein
MQTHVCRTFQHGLESKDICTGESAASGILATPAGESLYDDRSHSPVKRPTDHRIVLVLASLIGVVIAIAFAVRFVRSPKTIGSGLTRPFCSLLLVVLGCSAARLLFWALRGYAKCTGKVAHGNPPKGRGVHTGTGGRIGPRQAAHSGDLPQRGRMGPRY